jgi:beta-glucosidase
VAAGKTGQAVLNLPYTSFEFFDRASGKMAVAAGECEVWYGNSSDAKDLKMTKIMIQ